MMFWVRSQIKTERLLMRPWQKGDEGSLVALANNRNIWINLRDIFPLPYTLQEADRWIRICNESPFHHNFAVLNQEQLIGGIGLLRMGDVYRKTAEIGYWIGEPFWGTGFATEAVQAVTDWAFLNFDLYRIQAGVFEWNPASMRVLKKSGYHLEAKLQKAIHKDGKLIDEWMWVRLRES